MPNAKAKQVAILIIVFNLKFKLVKIFIWYIFICQTAGSCRLFVYQALKKSIMANDFSLKDKNIIVTGGTGILGNAFVNAIVEAGGAVGILGRNGKVAKERAQAINESGGKAVA